MKVALILPPVSLEERYGKAIANVAGTFPPLGLLTLGTMVKNAGHEPVILDGSRIDYQSIISLLDKEKPDIIGFSVMTFLWPKVQHMAQEFKTRFPLSLIIIGGVHPTLMAKRCMEECEALDAAVFGEGEYTLLELISALEKKRPFDGIQGMVFRKKKEVIENPARPVIENIDEIPIPDRSLLPITDYIPTFSQYRKLPVTNIFTSRGCPFKCVFCIPDVLGKKVRFRSIDSVIKEIKYLTETFGIKDIAVWDDTFTLNISRVNEFIDKLEENNIKISWSAQARTDKADLDLFKRMKKAGCWKLHFGLESMVQKNLDFLMKSTTVDENINAVKITKMAGMEIEASFIFGIPGETYEDGLKTIDMVSKLGIDYVRFFPLTPYDPLAAKIRSYGNIITDDLSRYQCNEIVFVPFSMTKQQLESLISIAYTKAYFNLRYILKRLLKLTSIKAVVNTLKGVRAVLMIAKKDK
jgi:anaerobic magnesium-protoporphyrin IX monomethyl ester cyclase